MKSLKGSKTEGNILAAFVGESQARNRYTLYAAKARTDGLQQIAAIFEETANQEREHAGRLFKLLEGGELRVEGSFPAGTVGSTSENLKAGASGEDYEWKEMYPGFAKIAREEGYEAVATIFEGIAVAEKQHAKRYRELAANVDASRVFKREKPELWRCMNCGYVVEALEAPKVCPVCTYPQAYFELLGENW